MTPRYKLGDTVWYAANDDAGEPYYAASLTVESIVITKDATWYTEAVLEFCEFEGLSFTDAYGQSCVTEEDAQDTHAAAAEVAEEKNKEMSLYE